MFASDDDDAMSDVEEAPGVSKLRAQLEAIKELGRHDASVQGSVDRIRAMKTWRKSGRMLTREHVADWCQDRWGTVERGSLKKLCLKTHPDHGCVDPGCAEWLALVQASIAVLHGDATPDAIDEWYKLARALVSRPFPGSVSLIASAQAYELWRVSKERREQLCAVRSRPPVAPAEEEEEEEKEEVASVSTPAPVPEPVPEAVPAPAPVPATAGADLANVNVKLRGSDAATDGVPKTALKAKPKRKAADKDAPPPPAPKVKKVKKTKNADAQPVIPIDPSPRLVDLRTKHRVTERLETVSCSCLVKDSDALERLCLLLCKKKYENTYGRDYLPFQRCNPAKPVFGQYAHLPKIIGPFLTPQINTVDEWVKVLGNMFHDAGEPVSNLTYDQMVENRIVPLKLQGILSGHGKNHRNGVAAWIKVAGNLRRLAYDEVRNGVR
tara:strand:- start:2292 stop:3608 length:1317 start_codon:yes stop_codon:yes gene_type:complete